MIEQNEKFFTWRGSKASYTENPRLRCRMSKKNRKNGEY